METKGFNLPLNLQRFSDGAFDISALDSLLDGNTTNTDPEEKDEKDLDTNGQSTATDGQAVADDGADSDAPEGGGPDNLESPEGTESEGEGEKQKAAQNAAFAKLRAEKTQYERTIKELAKALGIQEGDPSKLGNALIEMAQAKLAKDANVPVELYKELNATKEQLAIVQHQQNQVTAREKFMGVKEQFGLDDKELIAFAKELDDAGINLIENPDIDIEYEYYKRNRQAIEQKRIQQAVEEALRKSTMADEKSTTPTKAKGKPAGPETKVDNVSALNDLLDGK